jgi:hypothetical protein
MRVSGFTFIKNAVQLYIPVKQAIASVLPLCDEFVVALGDGQDDTRKELESLNDPRIKIINTTWDTETYTKNTVFARETDKAKEACSGDWLFYIQGDEALHEKYLPVVRAAMEAHLHNPNVDGLLFGYKHFWGDYEHYNRSHVFYDYEIRVIRNKPEIHSWKDAQSFRKFEKFDYTYPEYQNMGGSMLRVVKIPAEIYHYGWVRPPEMMMKKNISSSITYRGNAATQEKFQGLQERFDYGPLGLLSKFEGTHPAVMRDWIQKIHWKDQLNYGKKRGKVVRPEKHERLKYRVLSWIEIHLLGGRRLGAFKNYKLVNSRK